VVEVDPISDEALIERDERLRELDEQIGGSGRGRHSCSRSSSTSG